MEGEEVTEGENFIGEVGGVLTPCESLLSFLITFRCLFCFASFRFMSSCWLVSLRGTEKLNCVKLVKKRNQPKRHFFCSKFNFSFFLVFSVHCYLQGDQEAKEPGPGESQGCQEVAGLSEAEVHLNQLQLELGVGDRLLDDVDHKLGNGGDVEDDQDGCDEA